MPIQRRGPGLFEQPEKQDQDDTGPSEGPVDVEPNSTQKDRACQGHQGPEGGNVPDRIRLTVYATPDQVEWLDLTRMRIRSVSGRAIDRTALIRGILEGFRRSGVDLVDLGLYSERDLAEFIVGRLKSDG